MKFINKLERKYRRFAIYDLMKYFMIIWVAVTLLSNLFPINNYLYFYVRYFSLDFGKIFHGQIWRLVTFIFMPDSLRSTYSVIIFGLQVYLYLMIGRSLENAWGTFRFNLFIYSGILFNILGGLIYYIAYIILRQTGVSYASGMSSIYMVGLSYLFQSMFFAFAVLYPNVEFLLFYIIPIKVKYLAMIDAVLLAISIITSLMSGAFYIAIAIIVAMANFLIFYFSTSNYKKMSPRHQKRKATFRREVSQAGNGPRHRCAVCGRTELDGENLEFRYCSKCKGNFEYCQEHLFTHEHKK